MSQAQEGYGTTLSVLDITDQAGVPTILGEVTKISGPSLDGTSIDVTHLTSPDGFKEFIPGLVDAGEVTLTLNYVGGDAETLYSMFRHRASFVLLFGDTTSSWAFDGFITKFGTEVPLDDKVTNDATFKITGKPDFSHS